MMFDFHTHKSPLEPSSALVNVGIDNFVPQQGLLYSMGIHPWDVHRYRAESFNWSAFSQLVRHPQVLAVGEAGLDKYAQADMEKQIAFLRVQIAIAEELQKPLILHLVKAMDAVLQLKKEFRPLQPWVVHGFRGKPAVAEIYLKHGFYLSFGEKFNPASLKMTPSDRLLLETDDSAVSIASVYTMAAEIRGQRLETFSRQVVDNSRQILHLSF